MKILLVIFISIIAISCHTTRFTLNDLQQRSYFLALLKDSSYGGKDLHFIGYGTGFFVKKHDRLYLVSANHVFTGTKNDSIIPDKMAVFKMGSDSSITKPIKLDSLQNAHPFRTPPSKFPDALAYRFQLPKNKEVYSIENFIKKRKQPHKNDSLFFWGYPSIDEDGERAVIKYTVRKEPSKLYLGQMIREDSIQIVCSPTTQHGSSGSPVFFKRRNDYYFAGILFGGNDSTNVSYIVKYSAFLEQLK